jgi:hypothetical protein
VTSRLGRESRYRYFFYSAYIVNRVRRSQVGFFFIHWETFIPLRKKDKKRRSALTFFSCRNVPLLCSTCSENIRTFQCWFAIIFFVFIFFKFAILVNLDHKPIATLTFNTSVFTVFLVSHSVLKSTFCLEKNRKNSPLENNL